MIRFTRKADILNIGLTALSVALSVGVMRYGVIYYGLHETWPELVLNLFYIAALVMMGLYFFNRLNSNQFNYWSSVCVGITVLLRSLPTPYGLLCAPLDLSYAFGAVGADAPLFLCPQGLGDLHQAQPVAHLCCLCS